MYDLQYWPWELKDRAGTDKNSITIDVHVMAVIRKEYLACDFTCIIGQLGGNLGFFLGGSLLVGVDFILYIFAKMIDAIARKHQLYNQGK